MEIRKFTYIILLAVMSLVTSCSEDFNLFNNEYGGENERPIVFDFNLPDSPNSRAINGAKTVFANGDVIHISGLFTLANGQTETRYGALAYSSSTGWSAVSDSKLTWPNTAVSGVFTAYHVPTLNVKQGSIITNNDKNISLLQTVTPTSDPLFAETTEANPVEYGQSVKLKFSHLCTYLTLEDLTPAYNQFIFSAQSIKSDASSASTIPFNNAFYLQLTPQNTLEFGFCQSPEGQASYEITSTTVKNSNNTNTGNVSFFLQPGYYDNFSIFYPTGGSKTPFLNYEYTPLQGDESTPPMLEAGVAYVLNTVTSPGIIIQSPSQEDNKPWESGNAIQVDVNEFLTSILENREYTFKNNTILEKTNTGLKLNFNIDFKDTLYTWLNNGNLPNVPIGEVLDGDNHTIYNMACPLFNENNGTITNLGISNVNADKVVLNQFATFPGDANHPGQYDFSRQGALCRYNRGAINNIRMTDVTIVASVITDNDSDIEDHQDTENIGLITGSNIGSIDNVRLSGNLSITLNTSEQDTDGSNCTINLGGLVGQNADSGRINDIGSLDEGEGLQKISIINNCTSEKGAYYVGGVVGYNAGYIGPIGVPFIDIDCSQSQCTKSFIGIITGEITTSTGTTATIVGANVAGSVKAGSISFYYDLDSGSYVGGIAGASVLPSGGNGISITDCMVVAQLLDNSIASEANTINCTGGCFGRIYAPFITNSITLYLIQMKYPALQDDQNYFVGTFAGLAPSNMNWDWSSSNNRLAGNTSNVDNAIGGTSLN